MTEDQERCMALIDPLLKPLHDSFLDGMAFYNNPENYSPIALAQHRDRSSANNVYDHAFHALRGRVDGTPGYHFLNIRGLEVLNYCDEAVVRLKKVNGAGRGRNVLTDQQQEYDDQKPLPGLPDAAVRLVAGYQPDPAFTSVQRVIVSRPIGKNIIWAAQIVFVEDAAQWIDITPERLPGTDRVDFDIARRRRRH
jgi:hypothetical protein